MAEVVLDSVSRIHPDGTRAVDDLTLHAADGELLVLVGPSGCGKTTTLRMVAGLDPVDAGTIRIGGRDVSGLSPGERDVAMVTQEHQLYRHLDVEANLGFALSVRGVNREEVRRRVDAEARVLGVRHLFRQRPATLSAGHRQAVALGRATARVPAVFLMDEPLARLDAAKRVQLRAELARLQDGLGVTMLYVTNDQVEAMALGDRVAVLRDGRLQQLGEPLALYERPASTFVARTIGSPPMNLLPATLDLDGEHGWLWFGNRRVACPGRMPPLLRAHDGSRLVIGARPEHVVPTGWADEGLLATVERDEFVGAHHLLHCLLDQSPRPPLRAVARVTAPARRGERLRLRLTRVSLFDVASGAAVWHLPST